MTTVYIEDSKSQAIKACIATNSPALLIGETGTGKTTVIREYAREAGKELIRVSLNGSTSTEELLGKWLAKEGSTYWQDGVLLNAMKHGHWIVFDEINAALPEVLFALHSLLDDDRKVTLVEKDNEIVYPHEDFRFFASMNPTEEYAGTKEVNKALVSRFTAVINMEVPSNEIEARILTDRGIAGPIAANLVKLASALRTKKEEEQIYYFCSTRDLLHAGELIKAGMDYNAAIQFAIGGKMSRQELEVVKSLITSKPTIKESIEDIIRVRDTLAKENVEYKGKVNKLENDNANLISKNTQLTKTIAELETSTASPESVKDKMKQMLKKVLEDA